MEFPIVGGYIVQLPPVSCYDILSVKPKNDQEKVYLETVVFPQLTVTSPQYEAEVLALRKDWRLVGYMHNLEELLQHTSPGHWVQPDEYGSTFFIQCIKAATQGKEHIAETMFEFFATIPYPEYIDSCGNHITDYLEDSYIGRRLACMLPEDEIKGEYTEDYRFNPADLYDNDFDDEDALFSVILANDIDINQLSEDGNIFPAYIKNIDKFNKLFRNRYNYSLVDADGRNILFYHCCQSTLSLMKPKDIRLKDKHGQTAFEYNASKVNK